MSERLSEIDHNRAFQKPKHARAKHGMQSPREISLIVLDINDSRLELPRGNLTAEQNVQLTVRPVLEFRETKVGRHEADDCRPAPDVSALSRHVPACGVEHPGCEVDHGDLGDVVGGAADTGLRARRRTDDVSAMME